MIKKSFVLSMETFSEVRKQIHNELSKTKATVKEVNRADVLVEEIFVRMSEIGKAQNVVAMIQSRFGDLNLRLEAEGEE